MMKILLKLDKKYKHYINKKAPLYRNKVLSNLIQDYHIRHLTSSVLTNKIRIVNREISNIFRILKFRKKLFPFFLGITVILIPVILFSLKNAKEVEAGWAPTLSSWSQRKQLTITNNSGDSLAATTTVAVSVDTKSLYDAGKLQADCDDLRIVYQPSTTQYTELARYVVNSSSCSTSTATKVNFPLQATLANSASTTDYYVYYGNSSVSAPSNPDDAFDIGSANALLVCPFDGSTTCAAGETPTTATGAIRYSGSKSALSFDGQTNGNADGVSGSVSLTAGDPFTVEFWVYPRKFSSNDGVIRPFVFSSGQYSNLASNGNLTFAMMGCQQNAITLSANTWNHVAAVYSGSTMKLYLNGTGAATGTGCSTATFTSYTIGSQSAYYGLDGIIDEFRISNSIRYTSNFTPSTSPFVRDGNTKLLLHFDENGDDPRNTGKAIDDSGNGNHGTITGAKYVAGLVGSDASTTNTGYQSSGSYAGHSGVMLEEGTTNKITNPSFENSTYNTNWGDSATTFNYSSPTFTASMAKRNSAGPFAAGPLIQGTTPLTTNQLDKIDYSRGNQIAGNFYQNMDTDQGSIVLWWTPEYSSVTGISALLNFANNSPIYYQWGTQSFLFYYNNNYVTKSFPVTAGTTYSIVARWDQKNTLNGTSYLDISVNDSNTFGVNSQPPTLAPASTLNVGYFTTAQSALGIIEGLTYYRRPLYDGAYGINVGNGDEINQIYNSGSGKDPTLVTGSWDVVFALPTNASTGVIVTGTGEAWSHPHASNLLYTSTTNTGGFMMNGTYTSDGWAQEGTPTSVSALATGEKIFSGGYKFVSDAANEGIYYDKTVSAGNDWVVRALAHSDGTSVPKIILYDQTNGAEIGSLTGTTTSTRSAPDVFIFTGEAPAGMTTLRVKLINTASSGTTYWHQVEVLTNRIVNPSAEGTYSSGLAPSWGKVGTSAVPAESASSHSGSKAQEVDGGTGSIAHSVVTSSYAGIIGKYYSEGAYIKRAGGAGTSYLRTSGSYIQCCISSWGGSITATNYTPVLIVTLAYSSSQSMGFHNSDGSTNLIVDDVYLFQLTDVSLTVTPATQANSTETTGLRIDGIDTATQTISGLTTTAGTVKIAYTPRHSAATQALFGVATPYVFQAYNSANNYISVYWSAANTLKLEYNMNGGGVVSGTWDATGAIVAGTTYQLQLDYTGGGNMTLAVDDTTRITLSSIPAAFGTTPSTMYWGSKQDGTLQSDATFGAPITAAANTTAPYYKFGATSVSLTAIGNGTYTTSINAGATTNHTLSAYVYNGTSGAVGGTVDATVAKLVYNGTAQTTTYTDMGGGWWRLTYSAAGINGAANYGVQVLSGKTVYVDGVQLEALAYATTYTDGTLGTGYAWSGTAHNSTNSRTAATVTYSAANNISGTAGAISLWVKFPFGALKTDYDLVCTGFNGPVCLNVYSNFLGVENSALHKQIAFSPTAGRWYHIVGMWDGTTGDDIFLNAIQGTGTPSTTWSVGSTVTIGTGADYGYADAAISDVRVFDTRLTSAQVTDLYYAGLVSHSEGIVVDSFSNTKGQNPVAAWHMDEGYGTTTYDSSRYGNTGTISGATWQSKDMCVTGKCLKFNGTSDVVTVANTISEVASVGFWVKPTSNTASLLALNSSVYISAASGTITATGFTSPTIYVNGIVSSTLTANQWQYIEVTTATPISASAIAIGKANGAYTTGFIDEVKFYPYARSSSQVKIDSTSSSVTLGSGISNLGSLSNGLVGYWKMDEASWTNNCSTASVLDSSGNGNNGTACPNSTGPTGGAAGKFGNGGSFDGSNDYASPTSSTNLTSTTFTYSIWAKATSLPSSGNNRAIMSIGDQVTADQAISLSNSYSGLTGWGFISYNTDSSIIYDSAGTLPNTDQWYLLTLTRDSATIKFYIDGVLIKTSSTSGKTAGFGTPAVMFGSRTGPSQYFSGSIDEVRIYNRALSPKEVRDLYNFAPGPVGHWKMDEGSDTSAYDSSGNGNTGTLTNGPTWTAGKFGKAVSFDGSNDALNVTDPGSNSVFDLDNNFSIDAWIRTTSSGNEVIVAKNGNTTNNYMLYTGSLNGSGTTGKASFRVYDSSAKNINGSKSINDGNWHHVVGLKSGNNLSLYVDGTLDAGPTSFTLSTLSNNDSLTIGYRGVNNDAYFNGAIDDVRIYNYARTQKQIVEDMNAGHPSVGSPVGSAVGYWKFDEGYGTTAYNSGNGGSALNGTLTNMASPATSTSGWSNSGKFGKALAFDGSNDYVSVPDAASLDLTNNFAISLWFKPASLTQSSTYLLSKMTDSGTDNSYSVIWEYVNNQIEFYSGSYTGTNPRTGSGMTISDTNWHNIIYSYDGSTWEGYLDGVNKYTTTRTFSLTVSTANLLLGAFDTIQRFVNGQIDEVKIYNYALTSDEVKTEYNRGSALVLGSTSTASDGSTPSNSSAREYCVPGDTSTCNPPVAEWKFDEKSGVTAYDTSGNANTLIYTAGSGSVPSWTAGKSGSALNLSGTTYVASAADSVLDTSTAYTYSVWAKANTLHADRAVMGDWVGTGSMLYTNAESNVCAYINATPNTICASPSLNAWHLYSLVDNDTNVLFYVDGVLTGSTSSTTSDGTSIWIGTYNSRAQSVFDGSIDQVRIYNYARTPAQIAWEYNRGKPVGWWKMDECTGSTANDASGNSNNGTITIGASGTQTSAGTCSSGVSTQAWNNGTSGKFNASLNFDGTDDQASIPNMSTYSAVSISSWFRNTGAAKTVISSLSGICGAQIIYSDTDTTGQLCFSDNSYKTVSSGVSTLDSQWHHGVVTWDGTYVRFYVDGILKGTSSATGSSLTTAFNNNQKIGSYLGSSSYFGGQIDDVRIYNYALTATQVKELYTGGAVRFGPATGAP